MRKRVRCSVDYTLNFARNCLVSDGGGENRRYWIPIEVTYEKLFQAYTTLLGWDYEGFCATKYIGYRWGVRPETRNKIVVGHIGCQTIMRKQAEQTWEALAEYLGYEIVEE